MVRIYPEKRPRQQPRDASAAREQDRDPPEEFLAMLAHELRNPLVPLVAGLELIDLAGDPEHVVTVTAMKRQLAHLVRLVEDLLDASRLTSGLIKLRRQGVRVRAVVEHAVSLVQPVISERHHRLSLQLQDDCMVDGDPVRLAQVIANLLTNAAKYTPSHGELTVRCFTADGHANIAVTDNGRGISLTEQESMFALFTQGTDSHEGGIGVGLTLARQLVELHGGSLTAYSDGPGTGSEFRITLPATLAERVVEIPDAKAVSTHNNLPRHIVVIEDNDDVRMLTCELLTIWGHQVDSACSGQTGVDLVIAVRPDVVIVDLGLPDVDGYAVAKKISEQLSDQGPRLIALTGRTLPADRRRVAQAHFHEHIAKPAPPEALRRAITAEK